MAEHNKRVTTLQRAIKEKGLDSILVTSETNVSYLSRFGGRDSIALITPTDNYFMTDSRYIEEAKDDVKGFKIELIAASTYETIKRRVEKARLKKVGFESMNLPYAVANKLQGILQPTKLIPTKGIVEALRSIKDAQEILAIKRSVRLTGKVLARVLKLIKPGISEKYLRDRIKIEFIREGACPAFEPIVAGGSNSSKPHARPTSAKLSANNFVMLDMGCNFNGYNSDITKTILMGKVKDEFKHIYNIVLEAQKRAFAMIRPGNKAAEVDSAARDHIEESGYGKYFGHSVGHGVGMEVHEEPTISRLSGDILKPGMVFTIEPAIYIPKFGGVRIEDMALVTEDGCEILTR